MSLGVGFKESTSTSSSSGSRGFNKDLRDKAGKTGLSFVKNVLFPNLQRTSEPSRDHVGRVLPTHNSRGLRGQHEAALASIAARIAGKGHGAPVTGANRSAMIDSSLRAILPKIIGSISSDQRRAQLKPVRDLQSQQGLISVLQAFGAGSESESTARSSSRTGSFGFGA